MNSFIIPNSTAERQPLDAALEYARSGVPVFPVNGKDGYTPHAVYDATLDEAQIREWWRSNPTANVAYPMGPEKDDKGRLATGWIGVDVDADKGGDEEAFWKLVGGRVETRIVGSGGDERNHHIFFKWRPGLRNAPEGKLHPDLKGIGVRCQGYYFVAPPSIHPDTGQPYSVLTDAPITELPQVLVDLLTATKMRQEPPQATQVNPVTTSASVWVVKAIGKVEAGENRNQTGFWLAQQLHWNGLRISDAAPFMEDFQRHVTGMRSEPYGADEAYRSLRSAFEEDMRPPAVSQIGTILPQLEEANFTDDGNALRFSLAYGHRLKYVGGWGWVAFQGGRWVRGAEGEAVELARQCARDLFDQASRETDRHLRDAGTGWAKQSLSANRIEAMMRLAKSDRRMSASVDDFDRDTHLLNVQNGTVDLKTGALHPHRAEDLITHVCQANYDPDATAPRFRAFLEEIFPDDLETQAFLQRFAGYSSTGETVEEKYLYASGSGSNGKGVLIRALAYVLGDYAQTMPADVLTKSKFHDGGERITPAYHSLPGKRFAYAQEPGGDTLDGDKLKALVDAGRLTVNPKHKDQYDFQMSHTLWLAANKRLEVTDQSNAVWRRTIPVDFNQSFAGREDWELEPTLKAEAAGILAWIIRGAVDWYKHRLGDLPSAVAQTKRDYRADQDPASIFFEEVLVGEPTTDVSLADALAAYTAWQQMNTSAPWVRDVRAFAKLARNHGCTVRKVGRSEITSVVGRRLTARSADCAD